MRRPSTASGRTSVAKKLYLTGGIGRQRRGEAFGDDYELPNAKAYNETCAAIANALWNHRMFLLHGDAKYVDVLERIIYNGFLSGVSLAGDRFFYPNPLACDGRSAIQPRRTSSAALVRLLLLPGERRAVHPVDRRLRLRQPADDALYVNLFVGGSGDQPSCPDRRVRLRQQTGYPWDGTRPNYGRAGKGRANSHSACASPAGPGTAGAQRPLSLRRSLRRATVDAGGQRRSVRRPTVGGYASLRRAWKPGDTVEAGSADARPPRAGARDRSPRRGPRGARARADRVLRRGARPRRPRAATWCCRTRRLDSRTARDLLGGVTVLRGAGSSLAHRGRHARGQAGSSSP